MSNQFTPGPWRTFGGMVDGYGIMASDRTIVITQEAFNGLNHRANARLIAAAPALYEALEQIADIAHKCANSGLKYPGKAESIRDHKDCERQIRDKARSILALVDSKNGEL